ncbi:4'-phosphopantetheinyl transferase family protein [Streptosporangium sandarakinum]|uniref:4'-phosphopantetheinyl transferase family protein n=1 Tax=Streptosporangium sandarakinum TaxID=1260955 RepID=UPI003443B057
MITSVLSAGECHVWWADPRQGTIEGLTEVLSPTELERAARFRREPDLRRFLTGAWLLRVTAGAQLGLRPEDVAVDRSCSDCARNHGKPRIHTGGPPLHVSISHSGDRVGVALTAEGPLGVDVEAVPTTSVDELARCALTPAERRTLEALPGDERYEAFARTWVRKEAALKATGHGLRISPDRVEVSGPDERPALLSWPLDVPVDGVRILPLDPGYGYVGVVAVLTGNPDVRVVESDAAVLDRASLVRASGKAA